MKLNRRSGVLAHLTSIRTQFGIGDLGPNAYRFVDWLKRGNQSYWQLLPIGITDGDGSPYSGLSAFSGNPLLISLEKLADDKLLTPNEIKECFFSQNHLDYHFVYQKKYQYFKIAHKRVLENKSIQSSFYNFKDKASSYIHDLSIYQAIALKNGYEWQKWPIDLKNCEKKALAKFKNEHKDLIDFFLFLQFLFHRQWRELKDYANQNGILLIGDIPIFSSTSSCDVWSNQSEYLLNESGYPDVVSGAPPDSFSQFGQKWGNPLYNWRAMQESDYKWWGDRVSFMSSLFDLIRIDHFRGFESYWEIPASEKDARKGRWVKGPDHSLFYSLKKRFGSLPLIAEDLGFITEEVHKLRASFDIPGMKILQFAFEGDHHHPYLPQHLPEDSVVYTGTHDNNTSIGWLKGASNHERWMLSHYVKQYHEFNWEMIKMALFSRSATAIISIQDLIGEDENGRMNTPGTTQGNWCYQFNIGQLNSSISERLAHLTLESGRFS